MVACGTAPRKGPLDYPTPARPAARGAHYQGQVVEWGGVITGGGNRADGSWLEILAYPLSAEGRPLLDMEPLGRFRAFRATYIETADFAPGRVATVRGPLRGSEAGQVGSAGYDFPLIEAQGLRLWRETRASPPHRTCSSASGSASAATAGEALTQHLAVVVVEGMPRREIFLQ
jgi:starvation-inducible outer membrane lipoprotein